LALQLRSQTLAFGFLCIFEFSSHRPADGQMLTPLFNIGVCVNGVECIVFQCSSINFYDAVSLCAPTSKICPLNCSVWLLPQV
jgi:hypothetical protein